MQSTPGKNPKDRRRAKAALALPAALLALAGAALAPASAAAMDGQGTGTGSTCIERAPGVFIDSLTQEKCEPVQLPGETIVIHEPYKAPDPSPPRLPACSALVHKCGQAEEGRVPQVPRNSEKGSGQGRNRGPGAAKPEAKAKEPKESREERLEKREDCEWMLGLMSEWGARTLPLNREAWEFQKQIKEHEKTIDFNRWQNSERIANLFKKHPTPDITGENSFASRVTEIVKSLSRIRKLEAEIESLGSERDDEKTKTIRAEFDREGCRSIIESRSR